DPHTLTVTVQKDLGDGKGLVAAPGEHVEFTLTNGSATGYVLDATKTTCGLVGANTDAGGQCVIVFTSNSAGPITGHASVDLTIGGVTLHRESGDGAHGDSANAKKTFVDAGISLSPNTATNAIDEPHTFTATVKLDKG